MDFLTLFETAPSVLKGLPKRPKVFWYVSAGEDFRGPTYLTNHNIEYEKRQHQRHFVKPELFIYNCIGEEPSCLIENLSKGETILYQDNLTEIKGSKFKSLTLASDLKLTVDEKYIEKSRLSKKIDIYKAFYFELIITGKDYQETQKVLYFQNENINFYENVMKQPYFETIYLCATRQGTSFGGCKKSILTHIYKENQISDLIRSNFKPKYIISFGNSFDKIVEYELAFSQNVSIKKNYGNYIQEKTISNNRNRLQSIITKIDYSE